MDNDYEPTYAAEPPVPWLFLLYYYGYVFGFRVLSSQDNNLLCDR